MALATSTVIAGIGLAIAAGGAGLQYEGQQRAEDASEKAEDLRKQQMNLTAQRQRRNAVREMIINQAVAKSNAATQGVAQGDSAVLGAQSQQFNSAAQNVVASTQAEGIGSGIFSANKDYARGMGLANTGQQIAGFGNQVMSNSTTISRVGASSGLWEDGY